MKLTIILLLAFLANAKDKPVTPTTPIVTIDFTSKLWKAQSNVYGTTLSVEHSKEYAAMQAATEEWKKLVEEWAKICGDSFVPGIGEKSGEPSCLPKPKPEPPQPISSPCPATGGGPLCEKGELARPPK